MTKPQPLMQLAQTTTLFAQQQRPRYVLSRIGISGNRPTVLLGWIDIMVVVDSVWNELSGTLWTRERARRALERWFDQSD